MRTSTRSSGSGRRAVVAVTLLLGAAAPAGARGVPADPAGFVEGRMRAQAIVQVRGALVEPEHRALLRRLGLAVLDDMHVVPALLVEGAPEAILRAARDERVRSVEPNLPVTYDLATATTASRAKAVWDDQTAVDLGLATLRDDAGNKIDGRGVTVAVVDTGLNTHHPDLPYRTKVLVNLYPVSATPVAPAGDPMAGPVAAWQDMPITGASQSHGMHVAGIVAGPATWANGAYRGAAPGAALMGFGDQAGGFWYQARAWEWIYDNGATLTPPVRVITNSWGYGFGPCDEGITLTQVQRRLILDKGIVMTFSAGNRDGTGATDNVRTQPHCGPEGAIGVANYIDQETGTRDGTLAASSSRGLSTDPVSWPDVSAPGQSITSTGGMGGGGSLFYTTLSGTSMSTPHVAGIVALMLQANPTLTPAEVECLIEQTTYKFDPGGSDGPYASGYNDARHDGSNYGRGHGLADAHAAVSAALDLKHGNLVGAAWKCDDADPWLGARR